MAKCKKWVNTITIVCTNWAESIDEVCTEWADEGANQCTQWKKCSWKPWTWHNCIAGFFCKAWYWVSKWVCKAFAWIVTVVCGAFAIILNRICIVWEGLNCFFRAISKIVATNFKNRKNTESKIDHVFVLMLENRSYDHILGFSNIRGFDSITGERKIANGIDNHIHSNINPETEEQVFVKTPADFSLKGKDKDPGHSFDKTLTQLCGNGAQYPDPTSGGYPEINNSGFIQSHIDIGSDTPNRIMDCFSKEQLPVLNKLAEEFAICDNWFSSLPGPTTPNRFFLLAATSGGLLANPKPENISVEDIISGILGGVKFENGHIFDELDEKCIKWLVFSGDDFPSCILLDGMINEQINFVNGRIKDMDSFERIVSNPGFAEKFIFIEPKYNGGAEINPGLGDFTCGDSMHPLDDVTRGEKLIKRVYETIRNSPHWQKSVLLITFDEHGGFYDHVEPPKTVPPGDIVVFDEDDFKFKFDQLGPRVPTIIVSPRIKKGTIDSVVYDHTSVLSTIENMFGLGNLTERDKNANNFLHLFSLDEARGDTPETLPDIVDSGLECKDGELTEQDLIKIREDLHKVRNIKRLMQQDKDSYALTDAELGFAWAALIKVAQKLKYKDKKRWIKEFQKIQTNLDAVQFRVDVQIKLKYNKDLLNEVV